MYLDSHYFYDNATSTGYLVWKHGSVTPPAETHTWLYMQPLDASGAKNASFEPIIHKSDQFTKTGSGQIQEKLRKEAFCVGTRLVGERRVILRNNLSSWEAGVVEAPWIVRVSGFYYLFYSAAHCCDGSGARKNALFLAPRSFCQDRPVGTNISGEKTLTRRAFFAGSYAVGVARSKHVTGPYEKYEQNPILASNTGAEGFDGTGANKNTFFVRHFQMLMSKTIILPRQAWDKQLGKLPKRMCFSQVTVR